MLPDPPSTLSPAPPRGHAPGQGLRVRSKVGEILFDNWPLEGGHDEPQLAAAVGAGLHVDVHDPLEQTLPADAMRSGLGSLGIARNGRGGFTGLLQQWPPLRHHQRPKAEVRQEGALKEGVDFDLDAPGQLITGAGHAVVDEAGRTLLHQSVQHVSFGAVAFVVERVLIRRPLGQPRPCRETSEVGSSEGLRRREAPQSPRSAACLRVPTFA